MITHLKVATAPNTVGKWQTYDISAEGDHNVVLLNGEKTADFHAMKLARGLITLQDGAAADAVVKFRNIRILEK